MGLAGPLLGLLSFQKGLEMNKAKVADTINNTQNAASGMHALLGRIGFFMKMSLIKTKAFQKRDNPI